MVADEALWRQVYAALGTRISVEHFRAEREAMDFPWLAHRALRDRRLAGHLRRRSGAYHRRGVERALRPRLEAHGRARARVRRGGEIVTARSLPGGRRGVDDLLHLELPRMGQGTAWLREQLEHMTDRYDVREVV
jgi:hypothetical protein